MHHWDDKEVDWAAIDSAAEYIGDFCQRWGRFRGQTKEKYGTVRFYAKFNRGSIHDLFYCGYVSYWRAPWFCHFDIYYSPHILKWTGISWFLSKWQPFIYSTAYKRALKKWPHIQPEILSATDHPELIRGHTRKQGNELHILDLAGKVISTWEIHN